MVSTESDQSSGNRYHGSSPEEERQRTGLFRWDGSENLVPSWSVPPGLMLPGPRQPQAGDPAAQAPDRQAAPESAADDNSWPGVAPPAGWFLRAPEPSATRTENASPETASPETAPAQDAGDEAPARSQAPPGPASPGPDANPWRTVGAVPSPRREPDGSWSSPLAPKPAPRALSATQALYGRAGGPGFQPSRATPGAATPGAATSSAATAGAGSPNAGSPNAAGPSPWQRSHQLWSEAGIQWEQRPTGPQPRYHRPAPPQPRYQRPGRRRLARAGRGRARCGSR